MGYLLPLSLLAVAVVAVAAMPWRRPDPKHELMLELYLSLPGELAGRRRDSSR